MNYNYVTLTIPYVWQFKDYKHIKLTRSGMVEKPKKQILNFQNINP